MKSVNTLIVVVLFTLISLAALVSPQMADAALYEVLVTTRTLERGHVLSASDIDIITTTRSDPRAATDINAVIGMTLKRTIGADTTIKGDYLSKSSRKLKEVKRGGNVLIIIEREGLRITAEGRLREKGKIGDIVRIENLSSGKIISGKLIDNNTVVVNF